MGIADEFNLCSRGSSDCINIFKQIKDDITIVCLFEVWCYLCFLFVFLFSLRVSPGVLTLFFCIIFNMKSLSNMISVRFRFEIMFDRDIIFKMMRKPKKKVVIRGIYLYDLPSFLIWNPYQTLKSSLIGISYLENDAKQKVSILGQNINQK